MDKRINSFRELNVYQLAFELQQNIFEISKKFPGKERYLLTDQICRSSRSIGANIAEAWLRPVEVGGCFQCMEFRVNYLAEYTSARVN